MEVDLSAFDRRRILVIGDLMIDEYVWGDAERISPEAPVPVVNVKREDFTLGGAGNVVNNLISLGASASVGGIVGDDARGRLLIELLDQLGADTSGVFKDPSRPTTRKTRIIAASQQMLRIDREIKQDISEQLSESLFHFISEKLHDSDLVLISDYGKGVITKDLLDRIVPEVRRSGKRMIADPKGLDFTKYRGVTILTPNKKEAALASGIEIIDKLSLEKAAQKILQIASLESVLVTCGSEGMALFEKGEMPYYINAQARQVFDVSGAGDTAAAALGLALASGVDLRNAARIANTAAGIVVGKIGTAAVTRQELSAALAGNSDDSLPKYRSLSDLPVLCRELRKQGKRIVLTNGCFDLLHVGHVMFLTASKKQGDVLIVALDDDASVRKIKGPGRPLISEQERIRIISALDCVDYVVKFSSEDLITLIDRIHPDILTKGSNYSEQEVVGRDLVEKQGGKIVLFPITEPVSTSGIIHMIKNSG